MMVEPPGDFGRTGVLEVDDGIFVTVEVPLVEERARPMQQAGELELRIVPNALAVEAREQRSGRGPVKTLVVIKDPNFQIRFLPESTKECPQPAAQIRRTKSV